MTVIRLTAFLFCPLLLLVILTALVRLFFALHIDYNLILNTQIDIYRLRSGRLGPGWVLYEILDIPALVQMLIKILEAQVRTMGVSAARTMQNPGKGWWLSAIT